MEKTASQMQKERTRELESKANALIGLKVNSELVNINRLLYKITVYRTIYIKEHKNA